MRRAEHSKSVLSSKSRCRNGSATKWIAKELNVTATAAEIAAQAACREIAKIAFGPAWEIPAQFAEEIFFWKLFIPTVGQLREIMTTYHGIRNGSHRKRLFAAVRGVCEA
jgi:hypothetical protein